MNKNSHYYLDTCYQSDHLPELPDQTEDLNRSRRAKSTSARLPWGGTRDVVPVIMLYRLTPEMIRKYESNPDPAKQAGLQDQMNHERIRFEQLAWPIRLTALLMIFGKFSFFIFIALTVFTNLFISDRPNVSFIDQLIGKSQFLLLTCGIPLLLWLLGALILKLFLRPLLKPGRGPEWELNRRTGLVKIWHYPNRKIFRKRGKPTIEEVPFYEFDAYSRAVLGPYGTNSFSNFYIATGSSRFLSEGISLVLRPVSIRSLPSGIFSRTTWTFLALCQIYQCLRSFVTWIPPQRNTIEKQIALSGTGGTWTIKRSAKSAPI